MAITKSESKEQIERLVNNFDNHIAEYKQGIYNETKTRRDFIDPFLSALGWDVDNKQNLPESYREVIHEDKIKIDNSSRAPDYCITINGNKKFYVEAKKPSISLIDSISSAYQLRRYGWNAKMPISIITDFEEFSVYDCQVKPNNDDKATIARIKYITYKDYLNEFDFLWDTFSKESVRNRSLEKYFQSTKGKRASSSVDEEFLKSLDSWRDLLAKNLVLRNPSINEDQLNFSLQKLIDRIIFLRISEDRGVEDQKQLLNAIGKNTYSNLGKLFHIADQKYNSGLFDYKKDVITDTLIIDNEILQQIIEEMYYPKSPYEFSVIPVEILGHSYEQYLGKTITIESNHKIKIEVKPEVRKAGGVYYTPQYIVDYIVKNTVGKLLGDWDSGMEDRGLSIEDRNLGMEDSFKNINEENHESNQKLQGFESLAGINASDNRDLYNDKIISEGGNIFIDKSNEESGSISSIEYSRGERPIFKEGIYPSFINSDRIVSGTGNSDPNSIQSGISQSGNFESNNESNSKNRSNARSVNQISKGNSLTPKPKPLTPADVAKLKICDPACGSGSFLLGAYQYLLNWHTDYYNKSKIKNKSKYLTPDGNLTTSVKKEILLNNIYGVDIDTNAVEVTKLSLMIKAMEGETKSSINHQLTAFHERILPTLDNNIKCGNSLIGSDFYLDNRPSLFSDKEKRKINTFDWEKEFPTIFKSDKSDKSQNIKTQIKTHINAASNYIDGARFHVDKAKQYIDELIEQSVREDTIEYQSLDKSGFDVIIGNPPYGALFSDEVKNYIKSNYHFKDSELESYILFIEKAINLIKTNGFIGLIVPSNLMTNSRYDLIRNKILQHNINTLIDIGPNVFTKVSVDTCIFIMQNTSFKKNFVHSFILNDRKNLENLEYRLIEQSQFERSDYQIFNIQKGNKDIDLEIKIQLNTIPLSNYVNFARGIEFGYKSNYTSTKPISKDSKKLVAGRCINRYSLNFENRYIEYNPNDSSNFKSPDIYENEKILIRRIGLNIIAVLDNDSYYNVCDVYNLTKKNETNLKFILSLLNSKLMSYYLKIRFYNSKKLFPKIPIAYFEKLPIRNIDLSNKKEKIIHDNLVDLVEQMLENKKYFLNSEMDADKKMYSNICDSLDKKIDQLVYELYGLTEEEIKVVEGN